MVSFDDWCRSVDGFLKSRKRGYTVHQMDYDALTRAYKAGVAPVQFATQPQLPLRPPPVAPPPPPPPAPPPRPTQPPAVLNDPKYQLDTHMGFWCPFCGSTNLRPIQKGGTGMGFFGTIPFVLAASVVEAVVRNGQRQPFACNYCDNKFQ